MCHSTAPPSVEAPRIPYFAIESKARSEPLWIGCQRSTGWRSGGGTNVISFRPPVVDAGRRLSSSGNVELCAVLADNADRVSR